MNKIIHGCFSSEYKNYDTIPISLIYFDPPFNSNRNYTLNEDNNIGFRDIWKNNKEYRNFLEENIKIFSDLLNTTGSLFFHISANRMYDPHDILLKYFSNVKPIFWKKNRGKNNVKNTFCETIDIIFWATNSSSPIFNLIYQPLDENYLQNSYTQKDEIGLYALGHLETDSTRKGGYVYDVYIDGKIFIPKKSWRISKEEMDKLIKDNRIHVPKKQSGKLYKKLYKIENKGKPLTDLWDDIHSIGQGKEKRVYPTQKPVKLLERIILMASNEGDTILDPMCGSGTTAIACINTNRKYLLFDKNKKAIDVVKNRIGGVRK